MKLKKASPFDRVRHKFPPSPIYYSQLEEIIQLARERGLEVCISDDDDKYEYEDLEDLRKHKGDRLPQLTLNVTREGVDYKYVNVKIDSDGIRISSNKDDNLVPFWHEIKDIFDKQVPWYARFMKPILWMWSSALLLWLVPVVLKLAPNPENLHGGPKWVLYTRIGIIVFSLFMIAFSLFMSLFSVYYLRKNRGIHLKREHEIQGFWKRNREHILLLVIGTALGVIGTVIGTVIMNKLTGK